MAPHSMDMYTGMMSLIFGLLSFLVCPVCFAIAAIMLGMRAKDDPRQRCPAVTGITLGVANIALCVLFVILYFTVFANYGSPHPYRPPRYY